MQHAPESPPPFIAPPPWHHAALGVAGRAAAALVLVLVAAEILLRIFWGAPRAFVSDPDLGRMPRPRSTYFQSIEGRATSTYNNLGLRDRADLGEKKAVEKRLLLVGDSLTEAVEVEDDRTFAARLQARLAEQPNRGRVINAGRMAWLAGEMLHGAGVLRGRTGADAAIAVVRMGTFTAQVNEPRVLAPGYWNARFVVPDALPDGKIDVNAAVLERLAGTAAMRSRVPAPLLALKANLALLDAGFARYLEIAEARRAPPPPPPGAAKPRVELPDAALLQRRFDFFATTLARTFPAADPSRDPPRAAVVLVEREDLLAGTRAPEDEAFSPALEAACRAAGLRFLSTREPFRRLYQREHVLAAGFANSTRPGAGHLNERGHEALAEALVPVAADLLR